MADDKIKEAVAFVLTLATNEIKLQHNIVKTTIIACGDRVRLSPALSTPDCHNWYSSSPMEGRVRSGSKTHDRWWCFGYSKGEMPFLHYWQETAKDICMDLCYTRMRYVYKLAEMAVQKDMEDKHVHARKKDLHRVDCIRECHNAIKRMWFHKSASLHKAFTDPDFADRLNNTNMHVCVFKNGVLEFNAGMQGNTVVFRDGQPDDYMSLVCPYDYYHHSTCDHTTMPLPGETTETDPRDREAVWTLLTECLTGYYSKRTHIWGKPRNTFDHIYLNYLCEDILFPYFGSKTSLRRCVLHPMPPGHHDCTYGSLLWCSSEDDGPTETSAAGRLKTGRYPAIEDPGRVSPILLITMLVRRFEKEQYMFWTAPLYSDPADASLAVQRQKWYQTRARDWDPLHSELIAMHSRRACPE